VSNEHSCPAHRPQARAYTGGLFDGTEWAALVRLFKHNAWLEAGLTREGRLQAMLMFNF
jgi:hypothetical protein